MFINPEQLHDRMAHDEAGHDYVMLYIDPEFLLEATQKKDIIRFATPIVYDNRIRQQILRLSNAILGEEEEALCTELFLDLTDRLIQTDFSSDHKNDKTIF